MKTDTLIGYRKQYGLNTLIETGLDHGRGSGMDAGYHRYIAVDYNEQSVEAARSNGYDARHGDSGTLMPSILAEIDGPAVFWLDAHGIDCNQPAAGKFPGWQHVPLLRELRAICEWEHAARSVVLIDDMPLMDDWVSKGMGTVPGEVDRFLDLVGAPWGRLLRDGIYRLTP